MENQRRNFDRAFKHQFYSLVLEGGRSVAEVARSLGIHENLLHTWKRKFLEDPDFSFPGKGKLKPHDEELRQLKKDLADVREELDIVKKTLCYFSRGGR
jgi:transposase